MPHCGIRLSSFIPLSSGSNQKTVEIAHNLIIQGLKAIHHIESHFIVHRDIKEDNILVDTESGKLTLIDFGEAQHCPNSNMEIAVTATTETWGNLGTIPPELSIFLKRITRGTSGVFSYLKCDSFALALTFWDALLPQSNKFIGSTLNGDMTAPPQQQEPTSVVRPKSFLARAWSSLGWFPEPEPTVPIQSTMTTATTLGDDNQNNDIVRNTVSSLSSVLIGMMNPDKAARFSASEAISSLTNDKL
ncbi:hypothetical protein Pelo_19193 [Pelomyxa schiedti]|nr:hypothetical protein Pelo_19193 [Pelomyxa schiedti]